MWKQRDVFVFYLFGAYAVEKGLGMCAFWKWSLLNMLKWQKLMGSLHWLQLNCTICVLFKEFLNGLINLCGYFGAFGYSLWYRVTW